MNNENSPILMLILTTLLDIAQANQYIIFISGVIAAVWGIIQIVDKIRKWNK